MAGAFHGVTEADAIINVGVSGPGVVKTALEKVRGEKMCIRDSNITDCLTGRISDEFC